MTASWDSYLDRPGFLAGQRLMLGFEGTALDDTVKHLIRDLQAGGLILFACNIESPDQVADLTRDCQSYAAECGLPPLFISVDQEGGCVARLRKGFTRFPGNPSIRTREAAERFARITARELCMCGINMNLAPVLDMLPARGESIMKDRAFPFPGDPEAVTRLGLAMIHTFQENGIMAVAKHFPGIGRTVLDSHFHLPVLNADLADLTGSDLKPFAAAIQEGVCGVMLSHIFYPDLDPEWQASLSPHIALHLLRETLGFKGLSLTDDLDMKAIGLDIQTCVRQILVSGIDLALICHQGPNIDLAAREMTSLLSRDPAWEQTGLEPVRRILAVKQKWL